MSKLTKYASGDRSVESYMQDLSNYPRISPNEEKSLGRIIRGYLNDAPQATSFEADIDYTTALREFNRERYSAYTKAREKFILANLKLVAHEAFKRSKYSRLPINEMIQEGNIGLMRAVEKFDPERGFRFSTYATWWIRQAMACANYNDKVIRVPVYRAEKQRHVKEAFEELTKLLGQLPSLLEVADWLGRPVAEIESLLQIPGDPISLDARLSSDTDSPTIGDMIEDKNVDGPEQLCINQDLANSVQNFLRLKVEHGKVTERDLQILKKRFGLDGQDRMSLDRIGKDVGLTRERVHQIINHALARMRLSASHHFGQE